MKALTPPGDPNPGSLRPLYRGHRTEVTDLDWTYVVPAALIHTSAAPGRDQAAIVRIPACISATVWA